MRKFLSILLVVAMVFSLVVVGKVPVAKANITGLRTVSDDTNLPTYVMGELITGKTTVAGNVYLKDVSGNILDNYYLSSPGNFVLRTSQSNIKEGKYYVEDSVPSDVYVYLKYNISNVTPASAPAVGDNVLVSGRLYLGDTAQTNVVDGTTVVLAYEAPAGTWNVVTTGTTLNGYFNFYAKFANAARYALFVNDGYAPDASTSGTFTLPGAAIYYEWTVGPTSITVTNVIDPTLLYANSVAQFAYVRLTDADDNPINTGVTITQVSGVGSLTGYTFMADGVYELTVSSNTAGIMNLKVTTSTAKGTFSLYFKPVSNMWNPSVRLTTLINGFVIDGTVGFSASYGVGSSYKIDNTNLQYTTLDGQVYNAGRFKETGVGSAAFDVANLGSNTGIIMGGGQITITLQAMLWTPTTATALTAQPQEVKQVFKVNPVISGDIVEVTPTEIGVGNNDIKVNVKQANGIERNNARVTLIGVAGMFGIKKSDGTYKAPAGAIYTVSTDGSQAIIDAINVNKNIVGGNYLFTGLPVNKVGKIDVKVECGIANGPYNVSYHGLEIIEVKPKVTTLTADVDHLVAGQIYPVVKVSGGVKNLSFTVEPTSVTFSTIDNGDGTYIFNIQGVPDVEKIVFTATDPDDANKKYELTLEVIKPNLTFLSVHKDDGLITDSFDEKVEFKVTDPDTSNYMTPTQIDLVPQYTTWEVTKGDKVVHKADNLQVTDGTNEENTIGLTENSLIANWTYGNKNVDYDVNKPYVAVKVKINGQDIVFKNALLVSAPKISFEVQGRDKLELYVNQSNTISATALDAHNQPLKDAGVAIVGSTLGYWNTEIVDYLSGSGGITNADGKVTFTFTPQYIGDYKLLLAPHSGEEAIFKKIVAAVEAPKDETAPEITIAEPKDGAEVNTSTIKVKGTVTDNVSVASLYVNDMPVTLLPDGSFVATVTLSEGENVITVKAFDTAGNKAEKSIKVTYTKPVSKKTVVVLKIGSDIMTVNGQVVQLDAAPEIKEGRTFLPLRAIAEVFGAQVTWIPDTQGITVVLGDNQIGLQVGNDSAVVNGNVLSIVPPYIKNGRTMVPIRVIAEGLGATVEWDPVNYIVTITMEG